MTIVEEVEKRRRDAEQAARDVLDAAFAKSLLMTDEDLREGELAFLKWAVR